MNLIDQQYQRTPFYGVPRMTDYLNGLGHQPINKKRVERLYKLMDLRAIGPNPNTSQVDPRAYKYPYLVKNLAVTESNQVWAVDITYVGLRYGYMYLFAIIDLYSRMVSIRPTPSCLPKFFTQPLPKPKYKIMERSPRRSRTEWQQILANLEQSGLSLKAFGEQHQINYQTLIYWRQKFQKNPRTESANKFIQISTAVPIATKTDCIKIHFDNNLELELPTNYAVDDLINLLKGLSC